MDISKYKDKNFSILGDSISTFEGVSIPKNASYYDLGRKLSSGVTTVINTWWGCVLERLDAKLLVNNSISGSTVTNTILLKYSRTGVVMKGLVR